MGDRASLAGDTAAGDVRRHVDLLFHVDREERREGLLKGLGLLGHVHEQEAGPRRQFGPVERVVRALEALDWKEFVERQSVVERALRRDPAGVYPAMTFESRDKYRQVLEKIAKRSALTEEQVAAALAVDPEEWKAEIPQIEEWFEKFGDDLPAVLWSELDTLKARLDG